MKKMINVNEYTKKDIVEKEEAKEIVLREFDFEKEIDYKKFENEFSWEYGHKVATELPIKSTVSKIKEMQNEGIDFDDLGKKDVGIAEIVPKFMENEEVVSASRRGTLMHLFMQKLDLKTNYLKEQLNSLKEELVYKNIISEEEAKSINIDKALKFFDSKLSQRIKNAKCVEKEKAFCIKMSAKDIYENTTDESILVQGIIDLYAITENEEVILVDYKTDFVEYGNEQLLIEKYKNQLKIYKKALEEALDKKVTDVYIYSLYLNKEIKLDV